MGWVVVSVRVVLYISNQRITTACSLIPTKLWLLWLRPCPQNLGLCSSSSDGLLCVQFRAHKLLTAGTERDFRVPVHPCQEEQIVTAWLVVALLDVHLMGRSREQRCTGCVQGKGLETLALAPCSGCRQ